MMESSVKSVSLDLLMIYFSYNLMIYKENINSEFNVLFKIYYLKNDLNKVYIDSKNKVNNCLGIFQMKSKKSY